MELIEIGKLGLFISDGNYSAKYPKSSDFVAKGTPFIRANNIKNNTVIEEDMYYISIKQHNVLLKGHVKKGDLLITTRGNIGQVGIVPAELDDSNINAQIVLLRIMENNIINKFLMYCFKSQMIKRQLVKYQTGTALKQLPVKKLKLIEVPLPTLQTQKKIVEVLDKAQGLIDAKKEQIKLMDELIQSVFYDMFGDPVSNPMRWEVKKLGENAIINPKKSETKILGNIKVSFVPMANVSNRGGLILDEDRNIEDVYKGFTYFKDGDILFAKITPCMENGKGCIVRKLKNGIGFGSTEFHVIRPKTSILHEVFVYQSTMTKEFRSSAERNMKGSAGQKRVSREYLENYKLPIPPIELQNQFAEKVQSIEQQKQLMQQSLVEMENNFNSLMQRAFKGELFEEK